MTIIKKCKDCKRFMTDCNFSKVDKELQAMEDFIACKHFKSKNETNADKIRNMSDEELAEFLNGVEEYGISSQYIDVPCDCCCEKTACDECWKEWLQSEAE